MDNAIVYRKSDGVLLATFPLTEPVSGPELLHLVSDRVASWDPALHGALVVDASLLRGPDGAVHLRRRKILNGAVALDPTVDQELATFAQRRADKKAAKADAKMAQLATMTKQEFTDLTAAQKWDMVFAFMKAHMDAE